MIDAYKRYWKGFVNFKGRSTRKDFWLAILATIIISMVFGAIIGALFPDSVVTTTTEYGVSTQITGIPGVMIALWGVINVLPGLALEIRRMHDINKSGWWILISLIPLIGGIWLLILYCTASVNEGNRYGERV